MGKAGRSNAPRWAPFQDQFSLRRISRERAKMCGQMNIGHETTLVKKTCGNLGMLWPLRSLPPARSLRVVSSTTLQSEKCISAACASWRCNAFCDRLSSQMSRSNCRPFKNINPYAHTGQKFAESLPWPQFSRAAQRVLLGRAATDSRWTTAKTAVPVMMIASDSIATKPTARGIRSPSRGPWASRLNFDFHFILRK